MSESIFSDFAAHTVCMVLYRTFSRYSDTLILTILVLLVPKSEKKRQIENFGECFNHKSHPIPDSKRKSKVRKTKKRTKGTNSSSLFPKRNVTVLKGLKNRRLKRKTRFNIIRLGELTTKLHRVRTAPGQLT